MDTFRLIIQRLFLGFVVVTAATFLLAMLVQLLPGDLVTLMVPNALGPVIEKMRADIGLDNGPLGFFWKWYSGMLRGDFGNFYLSGGTIAVTDRLKECLPVTLLVILYVQAVSLAVAVPLGLFCAYREGSRFDRTVQSVLFTLSSVPSFASALILALIFSIKVQWLPPLGYTSPFSDFVMHLKYMALPVLSLSIGIIASYTRLLRADVIATLKEDYVMMASSKGISNNRVLWKHVLRPSSTTLLTSAALNMGALIGGTIIIEIIFQLPGLGYQIAFAVGSRQVVALLTFIAITATGYVFFNTMVDVITNIVDPRTRERRV